MLDVVKTDKFRPPPSQNALAIDCVAETGEIPARGEAGKEERELGR